MTDEVTETPSEAVVEATIEAPATEAPAASAPPASPDDVARDAFAKGVDEVKEQDVPKAEPAAATEAAKDTKPAEKPAAETPKPDAKNDAIEAEIKTLGLKETTAKRFRELASRPTEAEVAPLRARAEKADQWEQTVTSTGATPEQFSSALGYLQAINSGDPKLMGPAFDAMQKELQWLGQKLGREVPGLIDPLKDHADLAKEVEDGQLSRTRALEIVNQRAIAARTTEHTQTRDQAEQHRVAVDTAMASIGQLNEKLKASDPTFAQKLPMLKPVLALIRDRLPPAQWASAVERAYMELPTPATPAPKPPVSAVPLRPTGSNAAVMQKQPKDAMEAFSMGVASVR